MIDFFLFSFLNGNITIIDQKDNNESQGIMDSKSINTCLVYLSSLELHVVIYITLMRSYPSFSETEN